MTTADLFAGISLSSNRMEPLADGAVLLRGFAASDAPALLAALGPVVEVAPFRNMVTPGGHTMSVAMTNCGQTGWITDRSGYRYDPIDPLTARHWPEMPPALQSLASPAAVTAGFPGFVVRKLAGPNENQFKQQAESAVYPICVDWGESYVN